MDFLFCSLFHRVALSNGNGLFENINFSSTVKTILVSPLQCCVSDMTTLLLLSRHTVKVAIETVKFLEALGVRLAIFDMHIWATNTSVLSPSILHMLLTTSFQSSWVIVGLLLIPNNILCHAKQLTYQTEYSRNRRTVE